MKLRLNKTVFLILLIMTGLGLGQSPKPNMRIPDGWKVIVFKGSRIEGEVNINEEKIKVSCEAYLLIPENEGVVEPGWDSEKNNKQDTTLLSILFDLENSLNDVEQKLNKIFPKEDKKNKNIIQKK